MKNTLFKEIRQAKNDEERLADDKEVLKLGKLSLQKNIDNIERESDKINKMDIIDNQ